MRVKSFCLPEVILTPFFHNSKRNINLHLSCEIFGYSMCFYSSIGDLRFLTCSHIRAKNSKTKSADAWHADGQMDNVEILEF